VEDVTQARILTHPGPRPSLSLVFELENPGPDEWSATVVEPVIPWDLRAWVDGREVTVAKPRLDVPARAREVRLAAGERTELPCPIVLVFEPEEPSVADPFAWVLGAPLGAVELAASIPGLPAVSRPPAGDGRA
jgi:hypothetical protein